MSGMNADGAHCHRDLNAMASPFYGPRDSDRGYTERMGTQGCHDSHLGFFHSLHF
jgi:hypothetical protein